MTLDSFKKRKISKQTSTIISIQEDHEEKEVADLDQDQATSSEEKFPTEIMLEILLRVSIETLSRCRWVCRAWYNTIKHDSLFIKAYNTKVNNKNSTCIIFRFCGRVCLADHQHLHDSQDSVTFYTPKLPRPPSHGIYSCNGLVLAVVGYPQRVEPYVIWNPVTGEQMIVPKSPMDDICIRFDARINGFGYDPASKVFKMVSFLRKRGQRYGEIYNFGTGKWTQMDTDDILDWHETTLFTDAVNPNTFLNGALHWIYRPRLEVPSIASFKLDTEKFQQIPLPPGLDLEPKRGSGIELTFGPTYEIPHYLLILEGCLSIVHVGDYYRGLHMHGHVEIWVMEDYGVESSWNKKFIIRDIVMDNNLGPMEGRYKPIKLMENGELLLFISQSCKQLLGYYHPVTNVFRSIDMRGDLIRRNSYWEVSLHAGSLISPRDLTK